MVSVASYPTPSPYRIQSVYDEACLVCRNKCRDPIAVGRDPHHGDTQLAPSNMSYHVPSRVDHTRNQQKSLRGIQKRKISTRKTSLKKPKPQTTSTTLLQRSTPDIESFNSSPAHSQPATLPTEPSITPSESRHVYVLDTNVLIHNVHQLYQLKRPNTSIVVCQVVMNELYGLCNSQKQQLALDARRTLQSLHHCIRECQQDPWITIESSKEESPELAVKNNDDIILSAAYRKMREGQRVTLVTEDHGLSIKAMMAGVSVINFNQILQDK
ncbi:WW domain-containing protein [Planoprotostelium fungivorum]|uniref:WW domain-containing protein n=1 Tax=Planoprotostelium fungivorum TaxID=1890364 RepID=A0A2P6NY39_9EUKA|nr:WW domain-containing protein [Planoprotostelium fungivorum]